MPDAADSVSITVNGRPVEATKGELVIDACERNGVYIPRFCYHPRMTPVGMCRMCIVEIDTGRGPALQPSCMIQAAPDMVVSTDSPVTKKAQDGVLEFLLINHPLDCPVCDKGGECPLQDQTLSFGPGESRFVEEKRHFEKPIPISTTVNLDRERCILCDRCTRFAREVAGDPLISFQDRGNQTQVNTFPDHPFASYFSGNTVQICPVGALTATPYRFKARPWDLEQAESTCTSCSVGCRVIIDASRNEVLRYNGVDIDPVNWSWLCDKGRFDFQYVNSPARLATPLVRGNAGDTLTEARWSDALAAAAEAIEAGLEHSGPAGVAVLGGARLTNEGAYAWAKLAKGVIGTDNVDAQLGDGLSADVVLGLRHATIDDVCAGGTVLYLGPDPKEELPVLYLRLRHAVINDGLKLIELAPQATSLTPLAAHSLRYVPGTAANVCAQLLDPGTEPVGLDAVEKRKVSELLTAGPIKVVLGRPSLAESASTVEAAAATIMRHLDGVTFLPALRRANVHGALDLGLAPGVLPGRVTLDAGGSWFTERGWDRTPSARGFDAAGILQAAAEGRIDTLLLLGADPVNDYPDRDLAQRAIQGARIVVAIDLFLNDSSAQADIVLPAAGFAEVAGSTTNLEGRVSTLNQRVTPPGTARADWMIASELAYRLGADLGLESVDGVWAEIERVAPAFAGLTVDLLRSPQAADGVVVPLSADRAPTGPTPIGIDANLLNAEPTSVTGAAEPEAESEGEAHPDAAEDTDHPEAQGPAGGVTSDTETDAAQSARRSGGGEGTGRGGAGSGQRRAKGASNTAPGLMCFSGDAEAPRVPPVDSYSLRLIASRKLYDDGTLVQQSPALAGLVGTARLRVNPYDFERLGVAEGGEMRVTSLKGTATFATVPDPTVPRGAAALWFNQRGADPTVLIDATQSVTDIRVETA